MAEPELPGYFVAFLVLFGIAFVAVVIVMIVSVTKNVRVARRGGMDPWTTQSELAVRAANSQLLAPAAATQTIEQRLAEVDDLARRGVISADEHAAARARILAG